MVKKSQNLFRLKITKPFYFIFIYPMIYFKSDLHENSKHILMRIKIHDVVDTTTTPNCSFFLNRLMKQYGDWFSYDRTPRARIFHRWATLIAIQSCSTNLVPYVFKSI